MGSILVTAISQAAAANVTGPSIWLGPDGISRVSIHAEFGAVTGTWTVEASNDPRAREDHPSYSSAKWDDVTATFALTNPAGVAGDFTANFDNVNYEFLRISYAHTGGADFLYTWVSGRSG